LHKLNPDIRSQQAVELLESFILNDRTEVRILRGDLTQSDAEAIVNAANERLQHEAGVAGAIVSKGGRVIQTESNQWVRDYGPITHDRPALTTAGDLTSEFVVHVVGPRWGEGDEDRKLKLAIDATLELAQEEGFRSIAFPAISTGIFGFPMERAAELILTTMQDFSERASKLSLRRIDLVLFDKPAAESFSETARELWS
jgi:O-acetyl-ADP-ribose deacetylase (regulator of RNase III)